jgi:hypothetical protein
MDIGIQIQKEIQAALWPHHIYPRFHYLILYKVENLLRTWFRITYSISKPISYPELALWNLVTKLQCLLDLNVTRSRVNSESRFNVSETIFASIIVTILDVTDRRTSRKLWTSISIWCWWSPGMILLRPNTNLRKLILWNRFWHLLCDFKTDLFLVTAFTHTSFQALPNVQGLIGRKAVHLFLITYSSFFNQLNSQMTWFVKTKFRGL